jgi:hypothetical protein
MAVFNGDKAVVIEGPAKTMAVALRMVKTALLSIVKTTVRNNIRKTNSSI